MELKMPSQEQAYWGVASHENRRSGGWGAR